MQLYEDKDAQIIPGREIGAAGIAPCLGRVGVGRTSCLLAAGDDSGVTCPLGGWGGVDVLPGPEPTAPVIVVDVEGGAVPLGPGSRAGDGCRARPCSSATRIPGFSTIGRMGSGLPENQGSDKNLIFREKNPSKEQPVTCRT